MKRIFHPSLVGVPHLDLVYQKVALILDGLRETEPKQKIGFVSGLITSNGMEHLEENMLILDARTKKIRESEGILVFSAMDIFTFDHIELLAKTHPNEKDWIGFWRKVLRSGYVTDMFMTPKWEHSRGARDEFFTARGLPIVVHNPVKYL